METDHFKVTAEKLKGKTVEDVAITTNALVIKFTDGTYLDVNKQVGSVNKCI